MTSTLHRPLVAMFLGTLLLSGCASEKPANNTVFDFGPSAPAAPASAAPRAVLPALVVTDVSGSAALDSERMYYRLNYANPLEARSYANSRWAATPLQMLTQRLKTRIAQSGVKVLSGTDASNGIPLLRVDVDDFSQSFDSTTSSRGEVTLRASLFAGHKLVDQKSFTRATPAASANAAGGATALAGSTDAIASDIVAWLGTLSIPPTSP